MRLRSGRSVAGRRALGELTNKAAESRGIKKPVRYLRACLERDPNPSMSSAAPEPELGCHKARSEGRG